MTVFVMNPMKEGAGKTIPLGELRRLFASLSECGVFRLSLLTDSFGKRTKVVVLIALFLLGGDAIAWRFARYRQRWIVFACEGNARELGCGDREDGDCWGNSAFRPLSFPLSHFPIVSARLQPPRVPTPRAERCVGENIDLFNGRFFIHYTDLAIPGRMPIVITRYYDTASANDGAFGYGWTFNCRKRLMKRPDGSLLLREGGRPDTIFLRLGDDDYICMTDDRIEVTANGDGSFDVDRDFLAYRFDNDGKLCAVSDPYGNRLVFSYDQLGKLPIYRGKSIVARDFRLVRIVEIPAALTEVGKRQGAVDDSARSAQPNRAPQRYVEFRYNESGRIAAISDFAGRRVAYTYSDDSELLASFTDAEGNTYKYSYDNRLMTEFTPPGRRDVVYRNSYDSSNRIIQQRQVDVTIDIGYALPMSAPADATSASELVSIVRCRRPRPADDSDVEANANSAARADHSVKEAIRRYHFSPNGYTTEIEAPSWRLVYVYDDINRLIAETKSQRLERSIPGALKGDLSGSSVGPPRHSKPAGAERSAPASSELSSLEATTFDYDNAGNLVEATRVVGDYEVVYKYEYDVFDRLTRSARLLRKARFRAGQAAAKGESHADESARRPPSSRDHAAGRPEGTDGKVIQWRRIDYLYNRRGQLKDVKCYVGSGGLSGGENCASVRFAYDARGDVISIADDRDERVVIKRNGYGLPMRILDASDERRKVDYIRDSIGQIIAIRGAARGLTIERANNTCAVCDCSRNPQTQRPRLQEFQSQLNEKQLTPDYDGLGRLASIRKADGQSVRFVYDIRGRLAKLEGAVGILAEIDCIAETFPLVKDASKKYPSGTKGAIAYSYDEKDDLTFAASDKGDFVAYNRDRHGRIVLRSSSDDIAVQFAYDLNSRLTNVMDRKGVGVRYVYSDAGRLEAIEYTHRDNLQLMYEGSAEPYKAIPARLRTVRADNGYSLAFRYDGGVIVDVTYARNDEIFLVSRSHEEGVALESLLKDKRLSPTLRNALRNLLDALELGCGYLRLVNGPGVNDFLRRLRRFRARQIDGRIAPTELGPHLSSHARINSKASNAKHSAHRGCYPGSIRTIDDITQSSSIRRLEREILAPLMRLREQVAYTKGE